MGLNVRYLLMIRAQDSRITLKGDSIGAQTDGSLQIEVHDPQTGGRMLWPRHYYVVSLEVNLLVLSTFSYIGKTFLPRSKEQKGGDQRS